MQEAASAQIAGRGIVGIPRETQYSHLVMVALCNRADHYIFALWFLLLLFFLAFSAAVDWMSTILRHMVWL